MPIHPEILWAQRSSEVDANRNVIYLTFSVPDLSPDFELNITPTHLSFKGHSVPPVAKGTAAQEDKKEYAAEIDLFGPVEEVNRGLAKGLSVVLKKTDWEERGEEYWVRLTKEKGRFPFIKTDFSKWKDQDEQEEEEPAEDPAAGGMDFSQMMGGGMGGMGGMGGGEGGMGGMDFAAMMEQMKGMQGMEGLGAEGAGEDGEDEAEGEAEEEGASAAAPPPLEKA